MRKWIVPPAETAVEVVPAPTFSVMIPAYQAASFVADAVESALAQSVPAHEIIVCDDGSTDDIEGALAPYRQRIIFLRKENGGPGSARNAAARAASGDFLVILDADDVFLPEHLEALGELAAARPDLDILTTDAYLEVGGRVVGRCYRDANRFVVDDQRLGILERNFILHGAMRREVLLAAGGFDESRELPPSEDWECSIRLILDGAKAGLIDEPLARYRLREGSLTADHAGDLRARVSALERGTAGRQLDANERRLLAGSLRRHRQRALLAEAEAALRSHQPDARSRAFAIARERGFAPRTRFKAFLSALTPATAARLLARRQRRTGSSRLTRSLPRRPRQ